MLLNIILTAHALLSLFCAFLLVVVPIPFAASIGIPASDMTGAALDFARLYSVCMVGIAVLTWFTRTSPSRYSRRLVVNTMFTMQLVGIVLSYTLHYPVGRLVSLFFYALFAVLYLFVLWFRPGDIEGPYPAP